jgi:hypothetical protein
MTDAPKKIGAWETLDCNGQWSTAEGEGVEYPRADLSADLVRAALERAATEADRFTNPALVLRATRASGEPKLRFTAEEVMLEIRSVSQAIADRIRNTAKDDEAVAAIIASVLGEPT